MWFGSNAVSRAEYVFPSLLAPSSGSTPIIVVGKVMTLYAINMAQDIINCALIVSGDVYRRNQRLLTGNRPAHIPIGMPVKPFQASVTPTGIKVECFTGC